MRISMGRHARGWAVWFYLDRRKVWIYRGPDKAAAQALHLARRDELRQGGRQALGRTPAQRVEIDQAVALLAREPAGSLLAAVEAWLAQRRPAQATASGAAAAAYLAAAEGRGLRADTLRAYRNVLEPFVQTFGSVPVADLTGQALLAWVRSLRPRKGGAGQALAPVTQRNFFGVLHGLLEFCRRQDPPLVGRNVLADQSRGLPKVRRTQAVGFLSVAQLQAFLDAARPAWAGRFALLAFTGLRNSEARRMDAACVQVGERQVRVPEGLSKTDRGRLIEAAPECLWAWLEKFPLPKAGPLLPHQNTQDDERRRTMARAGLKAWPGNALRHGFATFMLAATDRNVGLVMEMLGHEGAPAVFHRHYKGQASKEEGLAFCAVRPRA